MAGVLEISYVPFLGEVAPIAEYLRELPPTVDSYAGLLPAPAPEISVDYPDIDLDKAVNVAEFAISMIREQLTEGDLQRSLPRLPTEINGFKSQNERRKESGEIS